MRGPYRAGPWPGLTPRGAAVLLGCAVLLACGQLLVGQPRRAWPDLFMVAVTALVPLALATRIVQAPGAAAAVCGAYLLPRTIISVIDPSVEPPPLLLVPALAFDLGAWLRASDLPWPRRRNAWRRRNRTPRRVFSWARAGLAGGIFGLVFAAVEPPFLLFLGGDPAAWPSIEVALAAAACALGCALLGLLGLVGPKKNARGRES
jgi:hypothetical protein